MPELKKIDEERIKTELESEKKSKEATSTNKI